MEDIVRYVATGFVIGVLFMTIIMFLFVFREFEKDIEREDKFRKKEVR